MNGRYMKLLDSSTGFKKSTDPDTTRWLTSKPSITTIVAETGLGSTLNIKTTGFLTSPLDDCFGKFNTQDFDQSTDLGRADSTYMGPAILSITDHQRLVALFKDPSRKSPNRGSAPRWLLSGIVVCGRCGNPKVNVGNGGQRRLRPAYVCARLKGDAPGCYARSWVDQVDAYVAAMVKARMTDPKLGKPSADVAERIDALHSQIFDLKTEQDELAESDLPLSMLKIRGAKLEAQIKGIEDQISALLPSVAQRFDVTWDEADLGQRRAMIESLTTRIELHPTGNGRYRKTITPDQVRITWR